VRAAAGQRANASAKDLAAHTAEAVAILREVLATRTLAEWTQAFAT
jgi:hypothetical protein